MSRRIVGLVWARRAERVPSFATGVRRPRGAKREGLLYERLLADALPEAEHGIWWEFQDQNGPGWCQTDLVLVGARSVLVLECKYSATDEAWGQIEHLYRPVLERALGQEVLGVQVARNLYGKPQPGIQICHTLVEAISIARNARRPLLHWKGLGPVWGDGAVPHPDSRRHAA